MTENEEIIAMGKQYLQIVLLFSIFIFIEMTSGKILQGIGNMIIPMAAQLIGAITNIILDPIFIFTFDLGISGAAIATVIGQFFAMSFTLGAFIFKKQEVSISLKGFKLRSKNVLGIMNVGLPVTVMNSVASLTTATMNSLLMNYSSTEKLGEAAVNVLGVYFKLQSFVFMPIFGLNQGGMPILAYNYGANNRERYYKTIKLILITALIIVSLGLLVFQLFPNQLLSLFNPNQDMTIIGIDAYRKISLSFIPAAFAIVFSMSFQAIGHGIKSLLMSLFRQLIILIPFAIFFSIYFSVEYIWYSYAIAEASAALIFVPIAIMTVRKQFALKQMNQELTPDL
jgi:putative MATE family efflux protein